MSMTYLAAVPLLLILYVYAGYPIVLKIASLLHARKDAEIPKDADWPTLSIVVTVYNAAHLIEEKLKNLSSIEYPGEMDINFVLDGCTDQTAANVQEFSHLVPWNVRVVEAEHRNGKEVAIRNAMPNFQGEVLMFSDADAEMQPDAVLELVKKLKQQDVGVVCGRELHLSREKNSAGEGQGMFYRYEEHIKRMQEQCASMCYIQGGVFAMWRDLYPKEIPVGCTQDGIIAFDAVLSGKRVAYQPSAVSQEYYDIDMKADFSRRIRTVSRAFYSVCCRRQIFNPFRAGWYGMHVLSARVLRWMVVPIALVSFVLLCSAASMGDRLAFLGLGCFFVWTVAALIGFALEAAGKRMTCFYVPFYFSYIHIAAMLGVLQVMLGKRTATWNPTG